MRGRLLIAITVALLVFWPGPAGAAGVAHVVVSFGGQFVPAQTTDIPVVITEGDELYLLNIDQSEQPTHDLVHCVIDEYDRCQPGPLFGSADLRPGEVGEVFGADELPAADYDFYCVIHPVTMRGTLTVLPSAG